jgi:hypothetical protein
MQKPKMSKKEVQRVKIKTKVGQVSFDFVVGVTLVVTQKIIMQFKGNHKGYPYGFLS